MIGGQRKMEDMTPEKNGKKRHFGKLKNCLTMLREKYQIISKYII